ncbi:MAG: signal peptidase I [Actinobacteria bacterium RBG_19FT_COMBO_54_7]|uniref:Signal peptidase I n=1 Tax=Candidatus Solincola sediminis TaxID=1797199 RepID=A0A1F2WGH2_9ACTN|nr:MAG: signal peptidase I [Candidatus Solincola sediminis]OFW69835.1 MAG: signal peptidase I [Actinobacteria bacterium RBG_19FT_COMBO_54_7]
MNTHLDSHKKELSYQVGHGGNKMRRLSKFVSKAIYPVVISIMIFAIFANFLIIAQDLFAPLKIVEGDSMKPTIQSNDAVLVTSVNKDQLKEGDIVVFKDPEDPEQSIVHRVIGLEETRGSRYAITKGDGNEIRDPFMIPLADVWGKVSVRLPYAGLFLNYLRSMPGFLTCVVCPFLLVFLYLVVRFYLETGSSSLLFRELIPNP